MMIKIDIISNRFFDEDMPSAYLLKEISSVWVNTDIIKSVWPERKDDRRDITFCYLQFFDGELVYVHTTADALAGYINKNQ